MDNFTNWNKNGAIHDISCPTKFERYKTRSNQTIPNRIKLNKQIMSVFHSVWTDACSCCYYYIIIVCYVDFKLLFSSILSTMALLKKSLFYSHVITLTSTSATLNMFKGPSVNTSSSYFFLSKRIALDPLFIFLKFLILYFPQI